MVTVTSTGERGDYEQLALSHVVASGWEIHNERLGPAGPTGPRRASSTRTFETTGSTPTST